MPLVRTIQVRGNSVGLVIPAQLVDMLGWKPGDKVEIEAVGGDRILLKLAH